MWETLDVAALLNRREEATMSGNAGAYPVPLGTPLRRVFPSTVNGAGYTKVSHPYLPKQEAVEVDSEMSWALDLIR